MNLRSPRLWISVFSAATVFYVVMGDVGRTSPGPLASVHDRESKLTGFRSCTQCHGGWFGSMSESCLACHEEVQTQIDEGHGLHGKLGKDAAVHCARCHSEHHGRGFQMVNQQSFLQAGFARREEFAHETVGFAMDGRHLEFECKKCHTNADTPVLPEDGKRFLGLARDCSSCHEDAHEGRMVLACASCHGQRDFKELESIGHARHLHLVGGHAQLLCRDCHSKEETHSLEALGAGNQITPRVCVDCHASPHAKEFVAGVAELTSVPTGLSCIVCHDEDHETFREKGLEVTDAQHACSGFVLDAPHDKPECADCHSPMAETFAARYPGRGQDECRKCHEDPHDGQFDRGPFGEVGCVGCHDRHQFKPHAFTVEKHARATLELTGSHLKIKCEECHIAPAEGKPRVFQGTPSECERCHEDSHAGFFGKFRSSLEAVEHGECAACHRTTRFSELPADGFDHQRWTGFPVEGAHAQVECEACHPRDAKPDTSGRTFGRVTAHFGPMPNGGAGCSGCHKDPHQGQFDTARHARTVAGRVGCARCHVQTSFRTFATAFDHRYWTGFALDGAHGKLACSGCHAPLMRPDEFGRTWARAQGARCADCHVDPHGGQFDRRGRTDCRRCHRNAASFTDLVFNHELHSRFPLLNKTHRSLECSRCHKTFRKGDVEIVRYRPLKRRCVDCHGEQRDPLRRRKRN